MRGVTKFITSPWASSTLKKGIFLDPPNLGRRWAPTPMVPIHMCVVATTNGMCIGVWSHGQVATMVGGVEVGGFATFWLTTVDKFAHFENSMSLTGK